MTREEAIEYLKRADITVGKKIKTRTAEALEMAIKALEQEPCEDCISREKALEALMDEWTEYDRELIGWLYDKIDKLPSVTPQPKMGRWIYRKEEDSYRCSLCTFPCHKDNLGAIPTKYCAGCGAKMSENPTGSERNEK